MTSRSTMSYRDIWTLRISDNFGRDGYGEIAPLAGLSPELESDFEAKLKDVQQNPIHYLENKNELIEFPSILFGLESAWLSYKHRDFIFYDTPLTRHEKAIPINALVWMGDYESLRTQIDEILQTEGVTCIKLKIGGINFKEELDLLKHIRTYRSKKTLQIRLDANGSFSKEEALDRLNRLSSFEIHSIEQPIKTKQYKTLTNLIQESPIPIALDEELIGIHPYKEKMNFLEKIRPHYLVLKPSLHGGMIGCEEWIFLAQTHKIGWWITSALESNIGLNAITQWCSRYKESYDFAQGLGTGGLYLNNFPTQLSCEQYKLKLIRE